MRSSLRLLFLLFLLALPVACGQTAPSPHYDPPVVPVPNVTSLSSAVGTAEGGAPVTIMGTNFTPGSTVRFGGIGVRATLYGGALFVLAPAHGTGMVDIEVANTGQSQTSVLAGAYSFVEPSTLDFNGSWNGYFAESEIQIAITVEDNTVTAVSCGSAVLEMSPSPTISNGRFAYTGPAGSVTGRILSPKWAEGTMSLGPCSGPNHTPDYWGASK